MTTYHSIRAECRARIKIQRSDFLAFLYPVTNAEQVKELIASHNKAYSDATHNCFAYILGFSREVQHFSDAGEPSGTAGKPILNALLSAGMTNVLAIVTRYYGGVKLGVRGLIEAYGQSVQIALEAASMMPAIPYLCYDIVCDYRSADALQRMVKDLEGSILQADYDEAVHLTVQVPASTADSLIEYLHGCTLATGLEYKQKLETK